MTAKLPDAPWRHRPGLDALLEALGAAEGGARYVGGAVRDTLLGLPVQDVDIATIHPPDAVLERLRAAAIKAVPTGINHGTITAVVQGAPFEITTLRRDVSTDGRRATVAFSDDWREDAARRDFTINALLADPATGEITDFFGGIDDLQAGRVRFIGDATARISEDHLRILRFFRFFARFGRGAPDAAAYAACQAQATSLMALSRERIADELLKLLGVSDPVPAVRLMIDGGILTAVLPEIDAAGVDRLAALIAREEQAQVAAAPLRRLCALLPPDPQVGDAVAARLKLSTRARRRIVAALSGPAGEPQAVAYRTGTEAAIDRILLDAGADPASIAQFAGWQRPSLGIGGGALIARGLPAGPDVAHALREVENIWIAEGFPDADRVSAIADQTVSKFQRARQ